MNLEQFVKISSTETTEAISKNNPNTNIVSKSYYKVIEGIRLEHLRLAYINNSKVISKQRKFKVNGIGVSRNEFIKHLN
jgi:hypothetical protein